MPSNSAVVVFPKDGLTNALRSVKNVARVFSGLHPNPESSNWICRDVLVPQTQPIFDKGVCVRWEVPSGTENLEILNVLGGMLKFHHVPGKKFHGMDHLCHFLFMNWQIVWFRPGEEVSWHVDSLFVLGHKVKLETQLLEFIEGSGFSHSHPLQRPMVGEQYESQSSQMIREESAE